MSNLSKSQDTEAQKPRSTKQGRGEMLAKKTNSQNPSQMPSLLERPILERLAVADDPRVSISVKDESSKDAQEGTRMLHRQEREEETEAMRKSRREQEERAKHHGLFKYRDYPDYPDTNIYMIKCDGFESD